MAGFKVGDTVWFVSPDWWDTRTGTSRIFSGTLTRYLPGERLAYMQVRSGIHEGRVVAVDKRFVSSTRGGALALLIAGVKPWQ